MRWRWFSESWRSSSTPFLGEARAARWRGDVAAAGVCCTFDETLAHQLAEDAGQALLGDAEDGEQFADADLGMAPDEINDAVMGAAEIIARQDGIRLGGEVAIGEIEQFDALPQLLVAAAARRAARAAISLVSAMLTYFYPLLENRWAASAIIRHNGRNGAARSTEELADMAMIPFDDRDGVIWFDGKLVPWRDAKVHVLTHALHYASCVFEGERVYGGRCLLASRSTVSGVIDSGPHSRLRGAL